MSKKMKEKKNNKSDYRIQRIEMLPFVSDDNKGQRTFWHIKPTGDYFFDCNIGRDYAALALDYMKEFNDPNFLTQIVMSMRKKKSNRGIEVGFFDFIAGVAVASNIDPFDQAAHQKKQGHEILKTYFKDE